VYLQRYGLSVEFPAHVRDGWVDLFLAHYTQLFDTCKYIVVLLEFVEAGSSTMNL
jgi:hypothetical protein